MAKKLVFSWLLKKAIVMALWTKAILCGKSLLLEQGLSRTPSRLKTKSVLIRVNPWLMKYLYDYKLLYNCRFITTNVKISLQILLFMQNKANFKKVKFYVSKEKIKNYEQMDTWYDRKKQSQTKPNKPKFKKAKMNVIVFKIREYEKMSIWAIYENKANSKPIKANFFTPQTARFAQFNNNEL